MMRALGHLLQGQKALEAGNEGYFLLSSTFLDCHSSSAQCYSPTVVSLIYLLSEMYIFMTASKFLFLVLKFTDNLLNSSPLTFFRFRVTFPALRSQAQIRVGFELTCHFFKWSIVYSSFNIL